MNPLAFSSYYALRPDEVIVCAHDTAGQGQLDAVRDLSARLQWSNRTKIVTVQRNPKFSSYLAWKRRLGFLLASNDRILSVDPDLILNGSVHEALNLVGKDNIGYVSCPAIYPVAGPGRFYRAFANWVVAQIRPPPLTGLYALWRPYWLDSEDGGIQLLKDPLETRAHGSMVAIGEDTYLLNCMRKKHRAIHFTKMAAYSTKSYHNVAMHSQYELRRYYAATNYSFWNIFLRSVLLLQPHLITGFMYQKQAKSEVPICNPKTYPF